MLDIYISVYVLSFMQINCYQVGNAAAKQYKNTFTYFPVRSATEGETWLHRTRKYITFSSLNSKSWTAKDVLSHLNSITKHKANYIFLYEHRNKKLFKPDQTANSN